MTGALNRGSFEKILNIYKNGEKPFAMIICDIDIFKHVNDTYGHAVGDEFAVIMVDVNQELSYTISEKITVINNQLYCPTDDLPAASLSVGVAFTDRANPGESIFKDADKALYRVKLRTASTAAASIKCARILRSCAASSSQTCFSRGAVRFAGHCWGRTYRRARFAGLRARGNALTAHSGASAGGRTRFLRRAGGCRGVLLRGYCMQIDD